MRFGAGDVTVSELYPIIQRKVFYMQATYEKKYASISLTGKLIFARSPPHGT
jgi:hypothetical protein